MQTNATLIDDAWAAFLAEHDVLVGVSVDGPRPLHDAYRVDKGGKPTFGRVMRGLDRLVAHGVRWNALTTVHRANEHHGLAGLPLPPRRPGGGAHPAHPDRRAPERRRRPRR